MPVCASACVWVWARGCACVGECVCQIDEIKLDLAMFSKTSLEVSKLFHNLEDEKDDLLFFSRNFYFVRRRRLRLTCRVI